MRNRVREIFEAAREGSPHPTEQASIANRLCNGDDSLSEAALHLLHCHHQSEECNFLEWTPNPHFLHPDLYAGELLGDYELVEQIGSGATGLVYRALRVGNTKQQVAIKLLRRGHHDEASLRRFELEKHALAKLSHPGVSRLINYGTAKDGTPYLVMEYVQGKRIDRRLSDHPTSIKQKLLWFIEVARIVMFAHEHGIIHRDLKPGNILVTDEEDRVVITDFGIAKLFDDDADSTNEHLTLTGSILGTPGYMAPEQITNSRDTTTSADIYGLGAVLYFLLAEKPPIEPAPITKMLHSIQETPIERPSKVAHCSIDLDLDVICLKCLEKEPAKRYRSVSELIDEVERYLAGVPIYAREVSQTERLLRWAKRNRVHASMLVTLSAVILAASVSISYLLFVTRQKNSLLEKQQTELLGIIDSQLTETAEWARKFPATKELSIGLLRRAKQNTEELASLNPTSQRERIAVAEAMYRTAQMAKQLGDTCTGKEFGSNASAAFKALAADYPDVSRFHFDRFHCQFLLDEYEPAFSTISKLTHEYDDPDYWDAFASCALSLGSQARNQRAKLPYFEQAWEVAVLLKDEYPDQLRFRRQYDRQIHGWRKNYYTFETRLQLAKEAMQRYAVALENRPADDGYIHTYWQCARSGIEAALALGKKEEAVRIAEESIAKYETRRVHSPYQVTSWRHLAELRAEAALHDLFTSKQDRTVFVEKAISELNAALLLWPDNRELKALKCLLLVEFYGEDQGCRELADEYCQDLPEDYPFAIPSQIYSGRLDAAGETIKQHFGTPWSFYLPLVCAIRGEHEHSVSKLESLQAYEAFPLFQEIKNRCHAIQEDTDTHSTSRCILE